MKLASSITPFLSLSILAVSAQVEKRAEGGYIQNPSGTASFTKYGGCSSPACGRTATGYTAALHQLAFGSEPGLGAGDACGRCFEITADAAPYAPELTGPFTTLIVKVTNLCPVAGNEEWCGQTTSNPTNTRGMSAHFDLCEDDGAADAFFPTDHYALTGTYEEVSCCHWTGSDGADLWNGACLAGEDVGLWPEVGCGNQGTAP